MLAIRWTVPHAAATAAVLFSAAWAAGAGQDTPREIDVLARRFAFEPARIEVTVGERVRLRVVSADGVHGLEIKKFRVNKEIPRGTTPVVIEFMATEAGEFPILCSEYCGEGHDDMKGQLVVVGRDAPVEKETPNAID